MGGVGGVQFYLAHTVHILVARPQVCLISGVSLPQVVVKVPEIRVRKSVNFRLELVRCGNNVYDVV